MSHELPDELDVDFELTRFVKRVRARALGHLDQIHPKLDYGTFTFLLAICDAPEGIRGSELAESLGVHKSTASRAVASLEKLGLVSRVPDPDDGRAQLLVAEPGALADVEAFRRNGHSRLLVLLQDWSSDEITVFTTLLARLNDSSERLP